jgi:2'-5' RNA ligase
VARLFSAVLPPRFAVLDLAELLADFRGVVDRLRFTPAERWHITLCFYGEDDPSTRARWLRERVAALPPPRLRLTGSATFPGVFFAGVGADSPADVAALRKLARRCGAERRYRAHLTLARWRAPDVSRERLTALLDGYTGPWFVPDAVALVQSEAGAYRVLERMPLTSH